MTRGRLHRRSGWALIGKFSSTCGPSSQDEVTSFCTRASSSPNMGFGLSSTQFTFLEAPAQHLKEANTVAAFKEDPRLGVITTARVLAGASIMMVTHDADDGGWQFLCGTTNDPVDGRIVHLADIVAMDPTVTE